MLGLNLNAGLLGDAGFTQLPSWSERCWVPGQHKHHRFTTTSVLAHAINLVTWPLSKFILSIVCHPVTILKSIHSYNLKKKTLLLNNSFIKKKQIWLYKERNQTMKFHFMCINLFCKRGFVWLLNFPIF